MLRLKRDMWPEAVRGRVVCRRGLRGPGLECAWHMQSIKEVRMAGKGKSRVPRRKTIDEDPCRTWKLWKGFG